MIKILLALAGFFYWWLLALIVPTPRSLVLLVLATVSAVLYLGFLSKKPVHALYAFVVISLFVPKGGENFVILRVEDLGGGTLSLFGIAQLTAVIAVGIRALRAPPRPRPRVLSVLIVVGLAGAGLTALVGLARTYLGGTGGLPTTPGDAVASIPLLAGTMFLAGCTNLISTRQEVERILGILVVFAATLLVEWYLYVYLHLNLPMAGFSLHFTGRFMSLFLTDVNLVGVVSAATMAATLHLAAKRRRRGLVLLVPAIFLTCFFTLQRATVLGLVVVVLGMLGTALTARRAAVLAFALAAAAAFVTPLGVVQKAATDIGLFYYVARRGVVSPLSVTGQSRVGAYLRGVDVAIASFPFGVGPNQVIASMESPAIPRHFDLSGSAAPTSDFYSEIASGAHGTRPHNAFISAIIEYGIAGLLIILLVGGTVIGVLRRRLRRGSRALDPLQRVGVAALAGFALNGLAADVSVYWLTFFMTFLIAAAPREDTRMTPESRETLNLKPLRVGA